MNTSRVLGSEAVEVVHQPIQLGKTELLIQLDFDCLACAIKTADHHLSRKVFLLCASNLPWDLDSALLRRLEMRILTRANSEHIQRFYALLPERQAFDCLICAMKHIRNLYVP